MSLVGVYWPRFLGYIRVIDCTKEWAGRIERFGIELELKKLSWIGTFQIELELNKKELSIWYLCGAAKDILETVAVQAMVFKDQEKLDNESAGQTLPSI